MRRTTTGILCFCQGVNKEMRDCRVGEWVKFQHIEIQRSSQLLKPSTTPGKQEIIVFLTKLVGDYHSRPHPPTNIQHTRTHTPAFTRTHTRTETPTETPTCTPTDTNTRNPQKSECVLGHRWKIQRGCCAALTCQRPVQCILEADPTSAESAQINLLCCQPGSVSRTSPA